MALGGAFLALMVCLWSSRPLDTSWPLDMESTQVSAPPELVAKLPLAAKATVAAGDSTATEESAEVEATAAKGISSERKVATSGAGTSSGKESVIIVGDTRYAWQEWSAWHCNCPAGSMSRVRDITYSEPGVRLDPVQYDVLRFERQVCSYKDCLCNRTAHQCDQLTVSCPKGPMHLCALEDIQKDQTHQQQQFWARVHDGLKRLWQAIRDTFPTQPKAWKNKTITELDKKS